MSEELVLFGVPGPVREVGHPPSKESAQRARTIRQTKLLAAGQHPLTVVLSRPLRLHPEAAPHDDRRAEGRRCGNCIFRQPNERGFPKCVFGDGARASHSAASDVRRWWPACADHEWKEA